MVTIVGCDSDTPPGPSFDFLPGLDFPAFDGLRTDMGACVALGDPCADDGLPCCEGVCADVGGDTPVCVIGADAGVDSTVDQQPAGDSTVDATVDTGAGDSTVDSASTDSTVDSASADSTVDTTVDSTVDTTVDSTVDGGVDATVDSSGMADAGCLTLGANCDPSNNLCCSGFCASAGAGGPICAEPLSDAAVADAPADAGVDTSADASLDSTADTTVDSTVDATADNTADATVDTTADTSVDTLAADQSVDTVADDATVDSTVDMLADDATVDSTVDVLADDATVDSTVDVLADDATVDSTVDVLPDDSTVDSTVDVLPDDSTVDSTVDTLPDDLYPTKTVECFDGIDNDGDGLIDSADPECTGRLDDSEGDFSNSIPGDNIDCKEDCFFDGDSGGGGGDCEWQIRADPLGPRNNPPSGALYNNCTPYSHAIPEYASDVSYGYFKTEQACLDNCLPITPNGCDCFGCCEMPNHVTGGTINIKLLDTCTKTILDQELTAGSLSLCRECTQVPSCLNTCEECEICVGKPTVPDSCTGGWTCPGGLQKCGDSSLGPDIIEPELCSTVVTNGYCLSGCCVGYGG